MQNVKIFRYTAAESANGLDMCLMVGGSEASVDLERSKKCAQAAGNLPCVSLPRSVCRTYLKFTVVLRYIGEQKDHPAIWQASPLPVPLTLGQFLVQTGWGILKVCLLEQSVELLDCSLKLTESSSARDLLSYWAGMVNEDQNECGYLVLGEKVLALADMIGFGQNMSEEDLGIFVNDVVDPPFGRTKGWIPDGSSFCAPSLEANKSIPPANLKPLLPKFPWFVFIGNLLAKRQMAPGDEWIAHDPIYGKMQSTTIQDGWMCLYLCGTSNDVWFMQKDIVNFVILCLSFLSCHGIVREFPKSQLTFCQTIIPGPAWWSTSLPEGVISMTLKQTIEASSPSSSSVEV